MIRPTRVVRGDAVLAVNHLHLNGGGSVVVFVHATGFCTGVWRPVVEESALLGAAMSVKLMDQRCHGASSGGGVADWWHLGSDMLAAVGSPGAIGVGHSSGGAALVLAELYAPGTFSSLILIEPIIPPPPYERAEDHPLAELAGKRRRSFPSVEAAAGSYRDRGPFVGWDERALAGYLDCGLLPQPDGSVVLACDPADEADFYRTANAHGAYSRLGELGLPTKVVFGGETGDFAPSFYLDIACQIPGAEAIEVPGSNHFLPMQRPALIAEIVAGDVRQYGTRSSRQ